MLQDNAKTAEPGGLLKKLQVCQRLSISKRTLNYRIKDGTIPHIRIGGSVRFLPADIDSLIKLSRVGGRKRQ
jgi:excisionase family DNA binding protein